MQQLDEILITSSTGIQRIVLCLGDLCAIPANEAVDLLVVSAFPDDYTPTSYSLIGALQRRGISIAEMARHKDVDLRAFSSCWLSQELKQTDAGFQRILCFEPQVRGKAPELVGDLFRSLMPFCSGMEPIRSIAMPILASGDQMEPPGTMLEALLDAAIHWLSIGMQLSEIKLVLHREETVSELSEIFRMTRNRLETKSKQSVLQHAPRYDAFISYSHQDKNAADCLTECLQQQRPDLKLFVDCLALQTGRSWQQHIYEALDDCRKVITLLSPSYIKSSVCIEEYNIAHFRNREAKEPVLMPIILKSAELPTYMKLIQWHDARESDFDRLSTLSSAILSELSPLAAPAVVPGLSVTD
jgi:hypothetical protein